MSVITDLSGYSTDRKNAALVRGVRYMKVVGPHLFVKLVTDSALPTDWLASLRWCVTHVPTGRKASANTPVVRVVERDETSVTLDIAPLFPSLGRLEMNERFRLDIRTASGRCLSFRNRPTATSRVTAQKIRRPARGTSRPREPGHLKVVR
jgi:hypothetical protein